MDKNLIEKIIKAIMDFLGKNAPKEVAKPVQPIIVVQNPEKPADQTTKVVQNDIDWSNPKAKITPRFSVKEALELQSWGVLHVPSEEEKAAIISIAQGVGRAADLLEQKLGKKILISVHAFMRPEKANVPGSKWDGQDYNRYIYETQVWKNLTPEEKAKKKVPKSPHRTGRAIDFHIVGYEGKEKCQEIRELLAPHLEELGLRMEKIQGGWIHLDDLPVGPSGRWFNP